jgi:hypothetical protein
MTTKMGSTYAAHTGDTWARVVTAAREVPAVFECVRSRRDGHSNPQD